MVVDCDFSDLDDAFDRFNDSLQYEMNQAGKLAVAYAKENGSYKDRTGNLRNSNEYHIENNDLVIENKAEYASYVEANGYEVLSGAALEAESYLKSKCR